MPAIHVHWDGPFSLEDVEQKDNDYDYGVYQVYGSHPIYGSDVLLYIGKASDQTFSRRIQQEEWDYNQDGQNIRYYLGRLAGQRTPRNTKWENQISTVEKLLIHSHWPAGNSKFIKSLGENPPSHNVHVLNWGHRRDLLNEVSGYVMTSHFDNLQNYHCYGDEDNTLEVE